MIWNSVMRVWLAAMMLAVGVAGQPNVARERFLATRDTEPSLARVAAAKALLTAVQPSDASFLVETLAAVAKEALRLGQDSDRRLVHVEAQLAKVPANDPVPESVRIDRADLESGLRRKACALEEANSLAQGLTALLGRLPESERAAITRTAQTALRAAARGDVARVWLPLVTIEPDADAVALLGECLEPRRRRDPALRAAVVTALGERRDPRLESLILPALDDPSEAVRNAAVVASSMAGGVATVDALIQRLERASGRFQSDIIFALRRLTGVNHRENVTLWRDWWTRERDRFRPPPPDGRRDRSTLDWNNAALGDGSSFYGLRTNSRALLYVLDVSGSMNEPAGAAGTTSEGARDETKLDRMKREAIRSLQTLPSGVSVNLMIYSDRVEWYAKKMVTLDDVQRRALVAYVRHLRADGDTNIHDAIMAALDGATGRVTGRVVLPDTIFLLTDGRPTSGTILDPDLIADAVQEKNRGLGVVIHTIGVGPGHARELMERISDESLGVYVPAR